MTLLVLGGTGEGRQLSARLHDAGTDHIVSLAGATRNPVRPDATVHIGGYGGEDGFRRFVQSKSVQAIVDATHPFAIRMTRRSARVAAELGIPYLQVLRPPWEPGPGDIWHKIDDESEAANFVKPGQVVFLATGRQTLSRFANLAHAHLVCRQIDPPQGAFPFPNGQFEIGRPPFSVEHECALFERLRVDWLITKNAGGDAPRSKLVAANRMGLPVLMIKRPDQPDVDRVETVDEAMEWLRRY
jgi:precorrin-6A/cobalt-precorrin-6A reductase